MSPEGAGGGAYQPSIPNGTTNFGLAYWRFSRDAFGAKLYAPAFAGWRAVLVITVGTAFGAMIIGVNLWASTRNGWTQEAKLAVAVLSIAGTLGLAGIWGAALLGNILESRRSPLITFDEATQEVELMREGVRIAKRDVVRLEWVRFDVRSSGPNSLWFRCDDWVAVWRQGNREVGVLLVRNGSGLHKGMSEMAACLGVQLIERHLGTFPLPASVG